MIGSLGAAGAAASSFVAREVSVHGSRARRAWLLLSGACGEGPRPPLAPWTLAHGALRSARLRGMVRWAAALPPPPVTAPPVCLCLHPRGSVARFVTETLRVQDFVAQAAGRGAAPFALVAVDGGDLWWHAWSDGRDPLAAALEEVLPALRARFGLGSGLAVMGWSMGGLGALLAPSRASVAGVVAVSPALFLPDSPRLREFGGPFESAAQFAALDPIAHPHRLDGVPVRLDCGDEDPFAPGARAMLVTAPKSLSG